MIKELKMGIKTESEHKDALRYIDSYYKKYGKMPPQKDVYKKISLDHLKEDQKYYTKLSRCKL